MGEDLGDVVLVIATIVVAPLTPTMCWAWPDMPRLGRPRAGCPRPETLR
jgi:hypothetical protein